MHELLLLVALFWFAFCFAKIEIEIEGKNGWASHLPTWRLLPTHWVSKFFFGGRPATGYHVWANVFLFSVFHIVYLFQLPTAAVELQILTFFMFFWILEDFLWFVLNPDFGIGKFNKKHALWHPHWWFGLPSEYFIFSLIGIGLYTLSLGVL